MNTALAGEFLEKASDYLNWSDQVAEQLRQDGREGRLREVERHFATLLSYIGVVHESLCKCLKHLDLAEWESHLQRERKSDPLLRYLWLARNSEIHDTVIKWRPSSKFLEHRVVDPVKLRSALFPNITGGPSMVYYWLFEVSSDKELVEKMQQGLWPSKERQDLAGVELIESLDSLGLDDFKVVHEGFSETVKAPEQHQGKLMPPVASEAIAKALAYYRGRFIEVEKKFDTSVSGN